MIMMVRRISSAVAGKAHQMEQKIRDYYNPPSVPVPVFTDVPTVPTFYSAWSTDPDYQSAFSADVVEAEPKHEFYSVQSHWQEADSN